MQGLRNAMLTASQPLVFRENQRRIRGDIGGRLRIFCQDRHLS